MIAAGLRRMGRAIAEVLGGVRRDVAFFNGVCHAGTPVGGYQPGQAPLNPVQSAKMTSFYHVFAPHLPNGRGMEVLAMGSRAAEVAYGDDLCAVQKKLPPEELTLLMIEMTKRMDAALAMDVLKTGGCLFAGPVF